MKDTVVFAPVRGVILRKNVEIGETVGAGIPVYTIGDLGNPWIKVYVKEDKLGLVKLGQKALREGNTTAATESFNKARSFDSQNADAIAGLGAVALKQGNANDATVHLEAASRLAPSSARIHTLRGQAYLAAGGRSDAAAAFKKALIIDPGNAAAAEGFHQASQ